MRYVIVVPQPSRVYTECSSVTLCSITAGRAQITYTLEAMVQLTCTIVHR